MALGTGLRISELLALNIRILMAISYTYKRQLVNVANINMVKKQLMK
jgi:hypothetical protein